MKTPFRHPKDLAEPSKVSFSVRINPSTKEALEQISERYGVTVSTLIDAALTDWVQFVQEVDAKGDGDTQRKKEG